MRKRKKAAQTAALDDVAAIRGSSDDQSSLLTDFGGSAEAFFEDAWEQNQELIPDDDRYEQFSSEEGVDEGKEIQLDRFNRRADQSFRRSRLFVALIVIIAVGVGGWYLLAADAAESESEADIEDSFVQGLGAIGDIRSYLPAGQNTLADSTALSELFRQGSDNGLERIGPATSGIRFIAVQWGGRMNVAVIGAGIGDPASCVVATLVDSDLRTVDVAAAGAACDVSFAPTGDRTSCTSSGLVLLELWPISESLDIPAGEPEDLRVRVIGSDGVSERGEVAVSGLGLLAELRGEPGDTINVAAADVSGTCQLIDRSDVRVQLL